MATREIQLLEYGKPREIRPSERKVLRKEDIGDIPRFMADLAPLGEKFEQIIVSYYDVNIFRNRSRQRLCRATPAEIETAEIMANEELMKDIKEGTEDIRAGRVIGYEDLKKKHGLL